MTASKTYLITGANRGIGKGYTSHLLQRPATTVIATVRDLSHPSAKELSNLPTGKDSRLILVSLDSADKDSIFAAVETLKQNHNIEHIDVVIANAGIASEGSTVRNTSVENIQKHILVNTIGPVVLFQATADLLKASPTKQPMFIAISTAIGSMGAMEMLTAFPEAHSPYGGSKAALNWFIRRLHFEEPWLTSFVFHPGLVETDMGNSFVEGFKLQDLGGINVETSIDGMLGVIDANDDLGGKFKNYDGTPMPW